MNAPNNRDVLLRIAEALERIAPPPAPSGVTELAEGYVWLGAKGRLKPVPTIARIDLALLKQIDTTRRLAG